MSSFEFDKIWLW